MVPRVRALGAWLAVVALAAPAAQAQGRGAQPQPQGGAQPQGAGDATARSRRLFQQGVAALDEGRFNDALLAFQEALRLRPAPILHYNIGLALRGLGRNTAAIESFEQYLQAPEPNADAQRLTAVRAEVDQLRASLARLTVEVEGAAAGVAVTVLVDGREQTAAAGAVTLDPGTHIIEVSAEGYRPFRRETTLPAGGTDTLRVRLESAVPAARLAVETSLPNAVIYLDGAEAGVGRVERSFPAGQHHVEIRAPGYEVYRRMVTLGATGLVRVDASLTRRGPGWLLPVVIVGGAAFVAGGVVLGAYLLRGTEQPYQGAWGVFTEM